MKFTCCRLLFLALFVPLSAGAAVAPKSQASAEEAAAQRWIRFQPEFDAFAEADRGRPPVAGGILFVGSSILRQWKTVAEQMAPLPVLNRAFGGSRTSDQLARFEHVVTPYAPRVIVYYCGSNDLKAATPDAPDAIFARFREFSQRARAKNPAVRLVFVSNTRSPDRVARWTHVDHYNALARAYCTVTPHHTFVDVNPALVDADGRPMLDFYLADKLHLKPPAYEALAAILKPVLEKVWREASTPGTAVP